MPSDPLGSALGLGDPEPSSDVRDQVQQELRRLFPAAPGWASGNTLRDAFPHEHEEGARADHALAVTRGEVARRRRAEWRRGRMQVRWADAEVVRLRHEVARREEACRREIEFVDLLGEWRGAALGGGVGFGLARVVPSKEGADALMVVAVAAGAALAAREAIRHERRAQLRQAREALREAENRAWMARLRLGEWEAM